MKKTIFLLFSSIMMGLNAYALTINCTAGGLATAITTAGGSLSTVTNLTVTGTIDARDFKILRSFMAALSVLDLSGVSIAAYTGTEGTVGSNTVFPINTVPQNALMPIAPYTVNILTSIILPTSVTSIGMTAFGGLTGLSSMAIPTGVTSIGSSAFYNCTGLKTVYCLSIIPPTIDYTCFLNAPITDVFVPTDGAVTAYKANTAWIGVFPGTIIKKGAPSAVPTLTNSNVKVYAVGHAIIVEGSQSGETVSVYNQVGVQLQTIQSRGERLILAVSGNGIYLIKTASKTFKMKL